jgi:hypothetical protein
LEGGTSAAKAVHLHGGNDQMKLKSIAGVLAALLFAFAVVACNNDDDDATEAPAESPAAAEASPAG